MVVIAAEALEGELQQLSEEIRRLEGEHAEAHGAAEALVSRMRASGVNPLADAEAFGQVDEAYRGADEKAEEISRLRQRRERTLEIIGRTRPRSAREPGRLGGFGWARAAEVLMSSPEYGRLLETNAFMSESAHVQLPPIEIMSREEVVGMLARGGLVRHATADVAAITPDDQRLFPPVPIPVRTPRVTELISSTTTDTDTIEYVEETTRTDVAAETAAGTAAAEATYVYTNRTALVRDIVQFTPAHKRNLADAGQIRGLLEGRLASGVDRRFESQIISGDGIGENLRGIVNTTGVGTVAKGATEPRLEAIHRAITTVRLNLFADPDAIGLHPSDYEDVVFEKDANGLYLLGPASQQTSRTVWGFPVVITTAFTAGTGLVGNHREGAITWIRTGVTISASDSHANFFTERRVALLAEMRAAFAAWQPKAFATVTGI